MRLTDQWSALMRRRSRTALCEDDPADDRVPASSSGVGPDGRVVLTVNDLLWFKTSEDEDGRITLGLIPCASDRLGVLVDDNGQSLGLRLSRGEAQDLHRSLVQWLAATTRPLTA